jgi:hypothetical protein
MASALARTIPELIARRRDRSDVSPQQAAMRRQDELIRDAATAAVGYHASPARR